MCVCVCVCVRVCVCTCVRVCVCVCGVRVTFIQISSSLVRFVATVIDHVSTSVTHGHVRQVS